MKYFKHFSRVLVCFLFSTTVVLGDVVFVDVDAASGGDGATWATAFNTLSEAIFEATNGDELWIAKGTYEEGDLVLYKSLDFYGGFAGGESSISQRDVINNIAEIYFIGEYWILDIRAHDVTIDGLYFDGAMKYSIHKSSSTVLTDLNIKNCTFTGSYEGAMIFGVGSKEINIYNCIFHDIVVSESSLINTDGRSLAILSGEEINVVNNTFIDNSHCHTLDLVGDNLDVINISNNIFQDDNNFDLVFSYLSDLPESIYYQNNVMKELAIATSYDCSIFVDTLYEYMSENDNNLIYEFEASDFLDYEGGDFRLSDCSAFVNVGNNGDPLSSEDISADPRIIGSVVDAGAFENQNTIERIYVDKNATGANNGTSWLDAYTDLQVAALASTCHTEIWMSQGIYRIDNQGVKIKNHVKLYGGFNGTQGSLNQRDWNLYKTELTGNFNITPSDSDDAPSLIVLDGTAKDRVDIDGFILKKTYSFNNMQPVIQSSVLETDIYVENVIFKNNQNELLIHKGSVNLSNVLIDDNKDGELFLLYSGGNFNAENCTFVNNENTIVTATSGGNIEFNNCLFWNNEDAEINANGSNFTSFTNCNYDTLVIDAPGIDSSNIYHYDPVFVDANNDDYSLADCSPLIDLGEAVEELPTYDLARNLRVSSEQIDIGAYEFQYPTTTAIYVDHTATGSNDGSSWSNGYTDLQDAISAASQGDQIWVAQGTYYPYDVTDPDPADRFLLDCGVSMYGGFIGNETSLSQRDVDTYETILSGRDVNSGNLFSYHVLRLKDFTADAVIDGFTIEGGDATGASVTHGAGIWMTNSLGMVNNCIIKNNIAERGAGIAILNSPKGNVRNCELKNNEANIEGGAVYVKNSSYISRNNIYSVNLCLAGEGGGVFFENSTGVIKNNRLNNNISLQGGAIKSVDSDIDIDYSTFINNSAGLDDNGGVLDVDMASDILIANSIIYGNVANNITNNFSGNTASIEINNSIVEGDWLGNGGSIMTDDPLLEDYVPMSCSPALDVGTLERIPNTDITIRPRIQGRGPDLGAYEQRNPFYIDDHESFDKIVCNSTTFELPYGIERYDTLYTEWDGSSQISGIMFDVKFNAPVVLEGVSAHFDCSGLATNKVYYKQGSYQGSEITASDWTEIHSSLMTASDNCALGDTFTLATDPVLLETGKRYGIYITSTRLNTATNYVYSSNDPTAGFGDTLYTDDLYTIFHGRGTRDFRFDLPTPSSQMFEGGLQVSRYDSIQWYKDGIYIDTDDTLEVVGGLLPGIFDYEAEVFISDGCSYTDSIQVTAYETITNDICNDAILLDPTPVDSLGNVSILTSNNLCASPSASSGSCNSSSGRDVWYYFYGTESGRLTITLDNIFPITNNFNPSITVFHGSCGSFTEIACVDDNGNGAAETVELTGLETSSSYYLIVDGKNMQMGIYDLMLENPCLTAFEGYDPLPDKIGSCGNEDLVLTTKQSQYDTLTTPEGILNTVRHGIYFNITSEETVNIHRISAQLAAQTGTHAYRLYTRTGNALEAVDDLTLWDWKGLFTIDDPTESIYEVPVDIDEVISPGDTLGIYFYCVTAATPGIKVNIGSKVVNNTANANDAINVLYGNSSNGPPFSNNLGVLEAWPIGSVYYEKIETVSWYKNDIFFSDDYDIIVTPVDFDEYALEVIDHNQCRYRDTTLIRAEGKVIKNTNDDGWQSLRSVVACAEWGVDTITFDPLLMGENIKLKTPITFISPSANSNTLFISGFSPAERVHISAKNIYASILFIIYADNDTDLRVANIDFRKSRTPIKNYGKLRLQNCTVKTTIASDPVISNLGTLALKGNVVFNRVKDSNRTIVSNYNGVLQIDGNVSVISQE